MVCGYEKEEEEMSKVETGGYTCEDCLWFEHQYMYLGTIPKGCCFNEKSDHYGHILSRKHPKCNEFEKDDR
jgi:hypothetical protein